MGLFFSIVVISLTLVVALAIAAAASTPRSDEMGEKLSLAFPAPPRTTSTLNKAPSARDGLTPVHTHLSSAGDVPASISSSSLDPVAPPVLFAAGLQ